MIVEIFISHNTINIYVFHSVDMVVSSLLVLSHLPWCYRIRSTRYHSIPVSAVPIPVSYRGIVTRCRPLYCGISIDYCSFTAAISLMQLSI